MQLGMIGLGRMGANMARRLARGGHDVVVHDASDEAVAELEAEGFTGVRALDDLVAALERPRTIWVMIPAGMVGAIVEELAARIDEDDTIVDGGNSWYHLDVDRAEGLRPRGIHYVDVGTSGGVHGLERGYCLMIGGDADPVGRLTPIFECLAPGVGAAARTSGRSGAVTPEEKGWLHCGPNGAGHFVKMVHNGIEYGLMAAYAEGLNVLAKANVGATERDDTESAPLNQEKYYRYDLDIAKVTELWRRGSVVTSWLLDLAAEAHLADPTLAQYRGHVNDSGEGRWTIQAAVDEGVPVPVLSASLFSRFASRGRDDVANRVLSAMRAGFGGHTERTPHTNEGTE